MKKSLKQFLIITFAISYSCFFILLIKNVDFRLISKSFTHSFLLLLACLGPLIASLLTHILNIDEFGGFLGFMQTYKKNEKKQIFSLVVIFLLAHNIFMALIKNTETISPIFNFIKYFPLMFILLGSQEIGWRKIIAPFYEEKKGFWKAGIATGLFWAIWFLPLIMLKNFVIFPEKFAYFAALLVGFSLMLQLVYKLSDSILYCTILNSSLFAMATVIVFKQGIFLFAAAVFDAILVYIAKEKIDVKNDSSHQ